jgi:transposase
VHDVRLMLTEDAWKEIAEVLHEVKRPDGRPPVPRDRMFLEAVLYSARTGMPWRDLPACFGKGEAVYNRFRRWEKNGGGRKLWAGLQHEPCTRAKQLFLDSTIVRAHQHAAGALKKKGGQAAQALGRARGGCSTTIHAGCIEETTGVSVILTGGEGSDMPGFGQVFAALPADHRLAYGVMDTGYDSNAIRATLTEHHMPPVIPPKKNRKEPITYDQALDRLREQGARFCNRLKQCRRIATRYDKLGNTYVACIPLVAALLIVK